MAARNSIHVQFTGPHSGSSRDSKKLHASLYQGFKQLFEQHNIAYMGGGLLTKEVIDLDSIHHQLGKAEGFVFMPGGDINSVLKLLSIFVGIQTGDSNAFTTKIDGQERQKALVVVDDGSWKPFLEVIKNTKFISDKCKRDIIIDVAKPDKESILLALDDAFGKKKPEFRPHGENTPQHSYNRERIEPKQKICVFCSASCDYFMPGTNGEECRNDEHNLAFQVGKMLANNGYGVVSGAGKQHMMGDVVRGAQSVNGWTAGSNTPHIRMWEGLPKKIDAYVDMPDIYARMRVMIEGSDGFVIAPGGAGSLQELMALLHLKNRDDPIMHNKPIILLNPRDADGVGYWDYLVAYLQKVHINGHGPAINSVTVVENVQELEGVVKEKMAKEAQHDNPADWAHIVQQARLTVSDIIESRSPATRVH